MRRLLSPLATLLFTILTAQVTQAELDNYSEFEKAYVAQRYNDALTILEADPQVDDPVYFYNLGNTHFRLQQFGLSVAFFEKAKRLKPHDDDILHNLRVARDRLSLQLGTPDLDPASSTLERLTDRLTPSQGEVMMGLVGFIVALTWIVTYYRSRSLRKTLFSIRGLGVLAVFCGTAFIFGVQQLALDSAPVICTEMTTIRSGPSAQYVELARIQAGIRLRLTGQEARRSEGDKGDIWYQIRFGPDSVGWIPAKSVLRL